MNDIVIIGAGGLAKEVAFLIDQINRGGKKWNLLGFVVSNEKDVGLSNGKYKSINTDSWLMKCNERLHVAFGIGSPKQIKRIKEKILVNENVKFPNLIHPNVIGNWDEIKMGVGNIVFPGCIFTTDIKIGSYNIFNLNCTIAHDVIIEDENVINPSVSISGGVKIGRRVTIGTGAKIIQNISVGDDITIAMGAVVMTNLYKKGTYFGNPAKLLK